MRGPNSAGGRLPAAQLLQHSTTTYGNIADPCQSLYINQNVNYAANCAAILKGQGLSTPAPTPNLNAPVVYGGGNSKLTPETSNSFTYGVVLQPRFIPGFDMTVDYWDIAIDNVITQLSYLNILDNCFDSIGAPNPFYCKLITRDTQGNVASIQAQYQNLASEHSRGIDIGANYRRPIGSDLFRASFSGSYTAEQSIVAAQGQPAIDYAGEWDYPRVRFSLITEYTHGMFTLGVNTRYISRSRYDAAVSPQIYQDPYIPSYVYNDLTLTIRPKAGYSISLGVKNIDLHLLLDVWLSAGRRPDLGGGRSAHARVSVRRHRGPGLSVQRDCDLGCATGEEPAELHVESGRVRRALSHPASPSNPRLPASVDRCWTQGRTACVGVSIHIRAHERPRSCLFRS
jgi:hypothetical protein